MTFLTMTLYSCKVWDLWMWFRPFSWKIRPMTSHGPAVWTYEMIYVKPLPSRIYSVCIVGGCLHSEPAPFPGGFLAVSPGQFWDPWAVVLRWIYSPDEPVQGWHTWLCLYPFSPKTIFFTACQQPSACSHQSRYYQLLLQQSPSETQKHFLLYWVPSGCKGWVTSLFQDSKKARVESSLQSLPSFIIQRRWSSRHLRGFFWSFSAMPTSSGILGLLNLNLYVSGYDNIQRSGKCLCDR